MIYNVSLGKLLIIIIYILQINITQENKIDFIV
jgi:hypothetical protein